MALFTDINDLLNKRKVEDNRIEFKRGWNPENIYHSIFRRQPLTSPIPTTISVV